MATNNQRILSREVEATVIPAGDKVNLPVGTKVDITHRLGGNFTIVCDFGMFRIMGKDADAIGEEVPDTANLEKKAASAKAAAESGGAPTEEEIWDALKTVYDPEIPVNIVDLGLIYSMQIAPHDKGGYFVSVQMTLTAPGCGMGPVIAEDAKTRVESLASVTESQVDIVWDPPWTQDMISEEGRMELGLL